MEQRFYEQDHHGKTLNLRSSYKRCNEPIEKYHKNKEKDFNEVLQE